jgi:uncharacterized membrane protein YhaH (DUF805 family)
MFKSPFSFDGRIRRTEYGISFIAYTIGITIVGVIIESDKNSSGVAIIGLSYIPLLWFLWAQGAKRCHDINKSGWWQIIPFFVFWLIFAEGDLHPNQYGENPKGIISLQNTGNVNSSSAPTAGYQHGNYAGGHNGSIAPSNPTNLDPSTTKPSSSGEYRSGDLYN